MVPRGIVDLLACWQGCFGKHSNNEIEKDNSLFMKYIMSKILGLDQHNIRLDMLQDLVLH